MKQTDSKGLFVQLYEYIWVYYICIWSELFVNELQALRDFSDCPSLMQTQHDTVSARSQMACNYSHHPCILYSLIYVYMKYVNISIYIWYIYIYWCTPELSWPMKYDACKSSRVMVNWCMSVPWSTGNRCPRNTAKLRLVSLSPMFFFFQVVIARF